MPAAAGGLPDARRGRCLQQQAQLRGQRLASEAQHVQLPPQLEAAVAHRLHQLADWELQGGTRWGLSEQVERW